MTLDRTDVFTPSRIRNLKNIIQIAAGQTHSMALDSQNNVWVYGICSFATEKPSIHILLHC
jgi:alpha-tubulin suppressor-like RCC1 family protein